MLYVCYFPVLRFEKHSRLGKEKCKKFYCTFTNKIFLKFLSKKISFSFPEHNEIIIISFGNFIAVSHFYFYKGHYYNLPLNLDLVNGTFS